jgi:glycolate oxidase FAD binding subunit
VSNLNGSTLPREFAALVGADRVRSARGAEAEITGVVVEPQNADELGAIVRKCEKDKITLAPVGAARTLVQIRRTPVAIAVSLARMNRVVAYDPADMTIIVEAGLTLGALNRLAGAEGQRLPLDPPAPETITVGALIAGNKVGPLRLSEGTVRDLLIGVRFVGHDGRSVHGGGRVVKNVAGYDLMKVMIGSFGTLGVITEAAFKIRPIPPGYRLALATFTTIDQAFAAANQAAQAAPLLHCEVLSRHLVPRLGAKAEFAVLAGIAGERAELEHQSTLLGGALGNTATLLTDTAAVAACERLRDAVPDDAVIAAQIAVLPAQLATQLAAARAITGAEFRAHAQSGVAGLYLAGSLDSAQAVAALARWRELAHAAGGHLRVVGARADVRAAVTMFDWPPAPALALMRRLKAAFDPGAIFNPGCFVGGL